MTWGFVTCGPNEALVISGSCEWYVYHFVVYVPLYPVMWNDQRSMDEECAFDMIDPKEVSFYKDWNFRMLKNISPLLNVDIMGSRL